MVKRGQPIAVVASPTARIDDGPQLFVVHRDSPLHHFGIQYSQERNRITVSCVLPETPGARANIPVGMVLRAVDGVRISDVVEILPVIHGKTTIHLAMETPRTAAI